MKTFCEWIAGALGLYAVAILSIIYGLDREERRRRALEENSKWDADPMEYQMHSRPETDQRPRPLTKDEREALRRLIDGA